MNKRIKSSNVQIGESFILDRKKNNLIPGKQNQKEEEFKKTFENTLIEADNQGKAVIKDAEKQAAKIIKKAEEDALSKAEETEILKQQSIENGYAEGFQKGYEEGLLKAKEEMLEKVWGLNVLISSAFTVKKEIINSAEMEILELSTVIAEKIIRHQLEIKPELMQEIIKTAIAQLKDKEKIKIIVNPALVQNLYEFSEKLKEKIKGLKSIKITEDKTIPKDGVIVESLESRIDGRIESQLKEIIKNIMQEFSKKNISSQEIPEEIEIRINEKISETESDK